MAVMIPDFVHPKHKGKAEEHFYYRFRDELDDSFTVFHDLVLTEHSYKLSTDADFVVTSERGVLTFEVKGGRVKQERGRWYFTDRHGKSDSKKESPMKQSSGSMYSLRGEVGKEFGNASAQFETIWGWATIFKDIDFTERSPQWDQRRIYDCARLRVPMSRIVDDAYNYSRQKILAATHGRTEPAVLNEISLKQLRDFFRRDFECVVSVGTRVQVIADEILRLTPQQLKVLDYLGESPRVLIHGGAGTGKTVLAMEKARRHARRPDQQVILFTFNALLAKSLKNQVKKENLEGRVRATTFHAYCRKTIEDAGMSSKLRGQPDHHLFSKVYPELFPKAYAKTHDGPCFDLLVVDEGQDFKPYPEYVKLMDLILRGGLEHGNWAWFECDQQAVNPHHEAPATSVDMGHYKPVTAPLDENWRNTSDVATFASIATGCELPKCLVTGGPDVVREVYNSTNEQLTLLESAVSSLLADGIGTSNIVILTATSLDKAVFAGMRSLCNMQLMPLTDPLADPGAALRYTTIKKFKGLESRAVILTDIESLLDEEARLLNYTGITRANAYLAVLMSDEAAKALPALRTEFGRRIGRAALNNLA